MKVKLEYFSKSFLYSSYFFDMFFILFYNNLGKIMEEKEMTYQIEPDKKKEEVSNQDVVDLSYANGQQVIKGGALGFFIGLAIIVPGVSGSAVAIIFKMYEKLLYAISSIFKQFKKCVRFLLPILIGALIGFVIGFFGVRALLNILPFIVICLFAGLMFGAFPAVIDEVKGNKLTAKNIALFIIGLLIPIAVSLVSVFVNVNSLDLSNLQFYHYIFFLVVGFLIAMTQLVPGLSATALLMSIGCFTPLMNSVSIDYFKENPMIFLVYGCLLVGFVIGLFVVSKSLNYMLSKYRVSTFSTIVGLSLGSILTMFFNPEVVAIYESWAQGGYIIRDLIIGAVVFLLGIIVAYMFVRFERRKTGKN